MKLKPTKLSYKQQLVKVGRRLCLSTLMFFAVPAALVKAQITPDGSLPASVEQQGENELNINGGEREGNNLFHSFEEFSVPEGIEAVFENAPDIENIFTRITGDAASNINGILRTQGGANFFLVNPNGIVFGENAQLDVGGSFVATTANGIQFADGAEFAANADEQPILTVSVPIGLQFDGNSGAIAVNGTGNQIASDTRFSPIDIGNTETGLSVITGKILALIGGNINFSGGIITAEGGRVEIASVNSGSVSLQETDSKLAFGYENADSYRDISLSQQALLNTSGEGQTKVLLTGNNISFSDGSFILSQNRGSVDSGIIAINAFGSLNLSGMSSNEEVSSSIRSESLGNGQGAKIDINIKQLLVLDEALIIASSYGEADGNELTINASDSVEIVDSSISASTFAERNAGNLKLSTSHLQVKNGGILTSSTVGTGNGGEVTVDADLIEVIGGSDRDRTNISASSFNAGNAGSLIIETEQLKIQNGGAVSSTAFAEGNAGSLSIKASESVEVSGIQQNATFANPESSIRTAVQAASPPAQQALGLPAIPTGNSGSLTLETPFLSIFQQGAVNVENQGTGDGGALSINADRLNLDEAGNITAASASGTGGNIDLNTENLQINDGSSITATAKNNGDGGNISINTATLVAKKNSEVTANSFQGRGGNLDINAEGLFLFDSPENIFSASSELGIDGTIQINTPDINLQRELEQSELELITADQAIANSCLSRSSGQAGFNVGGSDEFPKNPNSNYSDANFSLTGVRSLTTTIKQPTEIRESDRQQKHSMIPAQKMIETEDGKILLVAALQEAESIYCQSAEVK